MKIIKLKKNNVSGFSFIEENGNEFFIVIGESFNNASEEDQLNEAQRVYHRENYFLQPENKTQLETAISNLEFTPGTKEYIEAIEVIKDNLYQG